jgi:hypothetical protein
MERERDSARIKAVGCTALYVLLSAALTSCYSQNQQRLDKEIRGLAYPGMTVPTAIDHLSSHGFACEGDHPLSCSRIRQRLLPSSCVERVNIDPAERAAVLTVVDVRPIACAGF